MMNFEITTGRVKRAIRLICYGPEGIGKTSFAAQFPKPVLFIDTENGSDQLDDDEIKRFPKPKNWNELLEMVKYVAKNPTVCSTLVLDTADGAELLLIDYILSEEKANSVEKVGGGYGKGWTMVAEKFRELLKLLDEAIAKGVNVTICAHALMRKFESPTDPPFDRWEMKTSKKVSPLLKEWTDILLFADFDSVITTTDGKKYKATDSFDRVMYTEHSPGHDAKNRFGLAKKLPLSFAPLTGIYRGTTKTVPEHTMLTVDSPHEGIVEGDNILEDPRDVLIRKLNEEGVETIRFEAWCVATHRLAPGGHYTDLSGSKARDMLANFEILLKAIKGDKK